MAQALLLADTSESGVVSPGQPPSRLGAWLLDYDVDAGQTALSVCADFVSAQTLPVGTVARVIDLGGDPITIQLYQLTSQWVPYTPPETPPA